jgi:hypothetical protein
MTKVGINSLTTGSMFTKPAFAEENILFAGAVINNGTQPGLLNRLFLFIVCVTRKQK